MNFLCQDSLLYLIITKSDLLFFGLTKPLERIKINLLIWYLGIFEPTIFHTFEWKPWIRSPQKMRDGIPKI